MSGQAVQRQLRDNIASAAVAPSAAASFRAWIEAARKGYAPKTVEAWLYDLGCFEQWSAEHPGEGTLPERIAAYLRDKSAAGLAVATLRRQLATLARLSRAGGIPNPTATEAVQLAMREIARERGTDQHQAAGLNNNHVREIVGAVGRKSTKAKDARDLALLLVGRDLMARANELVSLTLEAISWQDSGAARVELRRKKTDTGTATYLIGPEAAAALKRWVEVSGITAGPVFVSLTKSGTVRRGSDGQVKRLDVDDVSRVLRTLAERAGFDPDFSSHSLRVGMAQDLLANGVKGDKIRQAAGWKTDRMLSRYTQNLEADQGAIAQFYGLSSPEKSP